MLNDRLRNLKYMEFFFQFGKVHNHMYKFYWSETVLFKKVQKFTICCLWITNSSKKSKNSPYSSFFWKVPLFTNSRNIFFGTNTMADIIYGWKRLAGRQQHCRLLPNGTHIAAKDPHVFTQSTFVLHDPLNWQ